MAVDLDAEIAFEFRHADDDDLWDALVLLAGPLARVVNALPDDERQATYTAPAASWGVLLR
ncbi:MAG: hypothetical protein ABR581_00630 [Thermoleophilaceae bacterium]